MLGAAAGGTGGIVRHFSASAPNSVLATFAIIGVIYAIAMAVGWNLSVPSRNWFVPRRWGLYGIPRSSLYFGAVLGAGFLTRIPYFGYFVLVAGCFGRGNLWAGAFVMTVFGAARALSVVVAAMWAPRLPIRPGRPREYYVVGSLQSMVKATHSWQAGSLFFVSSVILWFALSKG